MFGLGKKKVLASPVKELVEMLEGEDADKYFKVEPFSRGWVVGFRFSFKMKSFGNSVVCMNNTEDQYSYSEKRALSKALKDFVDKRDGKNKASRECLVEDIKNIKKAENSMFGNNVRATIKESVKRKYDESLNRINLREREFQNSFNTSTESYVLCELYKRLNKEQRDILVGLVLDIRKSA